MSIVLFTGVLLYEAWLSFTRLNNPRTGRGGYVSGKWELTHILLFFAITLLLASFAKDLLQLADILFWTTFITAVTLGLRAVLHLHLFYGRASLQKITVLDWIFALLHVIAALFLVITAVNAVIYITQEGLTPNTQFYPVFIPGLVLAIAISVLPLITFRKAKA